MDLENIDYELILFLKKYKDNLNDNEIIIIKEIIILILKMKK